MKSFQYGGKIAVLAATVSMKNSSSSEELDTKSWYECLLTRFSVDKNMYKYTCFMASKMCMSDDEKRIKGTQLVLKYTYILTNSMDS